MDGAGCFAGAMGYLYGLLSLGVDENEGGKLIAVNISLSLVILCHPHEFCKRDICIFHLSEVT